MKINFPLDKNTFGNTNAAEVLAKMISESSDVKMCTSVSNFLKEHNTLLNQISYIPDVHVRLT